MRIRRARRKSRDSWRSLNAILLTRKARSLQTGVSGISYNAALKLCTILLHASGYRPERALQHYRTIAALPLVLGEQRKDDACGMMRTRMDGIEWDVDSYFTYTRQVSHLVG